MRRLNFHFSRTDAYNTQTHFSKELSTGMASIPQTTIDQTTITAFKHHPQSLANYISVLAFIISTTLITPPVKITFGVFRRFPYQVPGLPKVSYSLALGVLKIKKGLFSSLVCCLFFGINFVSLLLAESYNSTCLSKMTPPLSLSLPWSAITVTMYLFLFQRAASRTLQLLSLFYFVFIAAAVRKYKINLIKLYFVF